MAELWSPVLLHLLKVPLYARREPQLWKDLLEYQADLRQYLAVMGLELYFDPAEGYAFLRQQPVSEQATALPRLMRRNAYTYWETLLLVLLRRRLLELDSSGDQTRLVLSGEELLDMMTHFWPPEADPVKLRKACQRAIARFEEDYLFLRRLPNQELEVERILRALLDAQRLAELEERLKHGTDHALG